MSRQQFSNGIGNALVELDIEASRLCGGGGAEYPYLHWQLQLSFIPRKGIQCDYAFRLATAQLHCCQTGQKISDAHPVFLHRVIHSHQSYWGDEYLHFEFPLNATSIQAIERRRQGGSPKFRLDVRLAVDEFGIIPPHPESQRPAIWGLRAAQVLALQNEIEVPQTHWIERVLPQVGHGKVHFLEFPAASLETCAALDHSFRSLKQAEDKHRLGFYDDAAGKCRVALEKFFDYEPVDPAHATSRKIPVLKRSWESKLGKPTYEWLKTTLSTIKDASNQSHHSPNAHFSQLDSQMILAITTTVVAYIARTLKPEDL